MINTIFTKSWIKKVSLNYSKTFKWSKFTLLIEKKERVWSVIFSFIILPHYLFLYLFDNNTEICNKYASRITSNHRRGTFLLIYLFIFFLFHHAKYPYFSFSPGIVSIPNGRCQACQPNVCPASRGCVWFISPRGLLVRPHSPRVSRAFFPAPRENPPRKTLHGRHKPVHLI